MRVAYHCQDVVGAKMAGPGIRAVELSRRLSARHEVTLVAEGSRELAGEPFRVSPDLGAALRDADAFLTQGFGFPMPDLEQGSAPSLHLLIEAMKRAYADRARYLGDPDYISAPVATLMSKEYAARQRAECRLTSWCR